MTERRIFEILLENLKNENYTYDFPKLQPEAVDIAAGKFADIICETVKQKSTASREKRANILKYLRFTSREKDCHLSDESYESFLRPLRKSLLEDENKDLEQLTADIKTELETEVTTDLADRVIEFYRRKNAKQREKSKKLELINQFNQEKLDSKFNLQVKVNIPYYETNENTIRNLISNDPEEEAINPSTDLSHTVDYREKQVKFGYALLNLRSNDLCLIETILKRIATYKELEPFEINFIMYLWFFEDGVLDFSHMVSDKFPFVVERLILQYAIKLLQLKEDMEVYEYFTNLKNDKKLKRIRRVCSANVILQKTMKSLIFDLYYRSTCNENVLKLSDFI